MLDPLGVGVEAGDQEQLNTGNKVAEVNLLMVKVTEEPEIGSSFTATKLEQWIAKNVT
ncbi:uncharacterized protein BO95DRAFT_462502 [Aspergillus brunneoviolaceus CBS 621.78]|uniref:Uncharacterized protein n=1 Tax=Aspergillus brunneoviolaceus CBS 621.78 TaxID=1450534 RepID=A0ACD1GCE1_9EURO|nr:hypothetical protein BO95DRAFT_462502 [Aspergillus brunneoviolaceus CBS 621.78]RAH46928.1 hypothetical protein BO95DRAFT_462502 [Aspergillus brunneoviolaceus CBS 621.78]